VVVFYGLNGWELGDDQDAVVALALDVAEGLIDSVQVAGRLKELAHPTLLPES
jgi:prophage maintenance system killer protein